MLQTQIVNKSETTTAATSLATSGIGWGWGNILYSSDLHSGTGERTESRLCSWTWGLSAIAYHLDKTNSVD